MTAIATNKQAGNLIASADFNAHALALKAMGLGNDDLGKLALAISLDVPFPILSSLNSVQAKAVGPSTGYTVPSGKLYYVRSMTVSAAPSALAIDPSDASAFTASGTSAWTHGHVGFCLGAGDVITTGTSMYLNGLLGDSPTVPSTPTRLLQEVNNTTTYTVPAGRRLLLTHAYPSTQTTAAVLNIDGIGAFASIALNGSSTVQWPSWRPTLLTAGQVLAAANAVNWTISGLLWTVV